MLKQRAQSIAPNYVILSLLALFALIPIMILFFNSVKTTVEIGRNPIGFPETIRLDNFVNAWNEGGYAITIRNSLVMMSTTIVVSLTIAGLAAYALARLKLRGASLIAFYFLVGTSVPPQLFMVPLFVAWRQIGLINTHLGLVIIYCGLYSPFATYLLRSYMIGLPEEFVEAARIDGASSMQVFRKIILPLVMAGFPDRRVGHRTECVE